MIPGAIKWCNICNAQPSQGVLEVYSKTTREVIPYDACQDCVNDIKAGKVDWLENAIHDLPL